MKPTYSSLLCLSLCAPLLLTACDPPEEKGDGNPSDAAVDDTSGDAGTPGDPGQQSHSTDPSQAGDGADEGQDDDAKWNTSVTIPPCDSAAAVEVLHQHAVTTHGMDLIGDSIYFASNDGLFSLPKGAPAEPTKVVDQKNLIQVKGFGNDLWFADAISSDHLTISTGTITQGAGRSELARDGSTVYTWDTINFDCANRGSSVHILHQDNASADDYVEFQCVGSAVERAGKYYAVDYAGDGYRVMSAVAGGESKDAKQLASADNLDNFMAATDGNVYVSVGRDLISSYLGRVPVAGGNIELLAGDFVVNGMFGNGSSVFVSDQKNHCLYRYDEAKGSLQAFGKVSTVEAMAFDDQYAYVATFGGTIGRIPLK
ncbi:MAG: hypothetical protein QM778_28880 [Myxococcales bacterium]